MYKDRKETTHVEVGEEDIHYHILRFVCEKHRKIANVSTYYDDLRYQKITLTHTQS